MRESKLMTFLKKIAKILLRIFWRTEIFFESSALKKSENCNKNSGKLFAEKQKKCQKISAEIARKIPENRGFILAANHVSKLDPMILMALSQKNLHFFAKKEIGEKWRFVTKNIGLIFVDRDKKNNDAISAAKKMLNQNLAIAIFPEGTRNPKVKKRDELLPFKIGAVKIAAQTGAPIIPVAICKEKPLFAKIRVTIGEEILVKKSDDLFLKNEEFRDKIAEMLKNQGVNVRKIAGKPRKNPGKIPENEKTRKSREK